jgi:MFS family permease
MGETEITTKVGTEDKVRHKLAQWRRQRRSRGRLRWSSIRYRLGESGWASASWSERLRAGRHGGRRRGEQRRRLTQSRSRTERNILYLYLEIFWAGVFMAALAFNATYALRLGASNTLMGWLSSIPALFAMIVLMPSARFLESRSDRGPWMHWSLAIGRGAFLGAALVPWIFKQHAAEAVVAVLILRTIPMHFFSAGFSPMLADVIPIRDRGAVMANRSIIMSATIATCTFLFGKWMDAAANIAWAAFPTNYQIVYIVGTAAGLLSTYFISRVQLPRTAVIRRKRSAAAAREVEPSAPAAADAVDPALAPLKRRPRAWRWARTSVARATSAVAATWTRLLAKLQSSRRSAQAMAKENQGFVRIVINSFFFNGGAWLVGPLYTILFVNQLGASDSWIGLNTTLAHIGVIGGNLIWRRLMDRWGADRALRYSVLPAAIYAFLVALFPNLTWILLWGVLISLVNPGVNLSHTSTLYELCPPERRASYLAIYATVANVGAFLAPLAGVALSNVMDIRWVLLIGGVIRLAGAGLFQIYRVRPVEASAAA